MYMIDQVESWLHVDLDPDFTSHHFQLYGSIDPLTGGIFLAFAKIMSYDPSAAVIGTLSSVANNSRQNQA